MGKMTLSQQLLQDETKHVMDELGVDKPTAFARLAHSLITGQSLHSFALADWVCGEGEKQIDTFTIVEDEDSAAVYLVQAKSSGGFSSNTLALIRNGLGWVFSKPMADVNQLPNQPFRDRISEFRSVRKQYGPRNIAVTVAYACPGTTRDISAEFGQELKTLTDQYSKDYGSFEFHPYGADELIAALQEYRRRPRQIDRDVPYVFILGAAPLIEHETKGIKGVVCTVPASEIARVVSDDPLGAVFDQNVRRFRGLRGGVNADILATCSGADTGHEFWFLNNGITIVCDHLDVVKDPDSPILKLKNMQIVNGCQTATVFSKAAAAGTLAPETRVLVRVYRPEDRTLVDRIVRATNNQNKITSRDLHANDPVQIQMQEAFRKYGYWYERKPHQYDGQAGVDVARIMPNEFVAQSYLATVLRTPSDARRRKYKVWGERYGDVFPDEAVGSHVLAYLICRQAAEWLKDSGFGRCDDERRRKIANNGVFHVARIAAFLWRQGDDWDSDPAATARQIATLERNPTAIHAKCATAFRKLLKLITSDASYSDDIDAALKRPGLDDQIGKTLHRPKRSRTSP